MINNIVMLSGVLIPQSETCTQSKDRFLTNAPSVILTRMCHVSILFALTLLLTAFASAQTLTGIVKNATTGKPSAGDEVVLLKLGEGMEEAGRTKTDSGGHFTFKLDDAQAPHLVRAIHQEVTYHRMAPPGTTSVELEVYDAAKKIEGISVVADIMRVQADRGQLIVVREFGVQNSSKPPRTQMDEHNLEFNVPGGAQIISDSATATTEGGNPLKSAPVPEGEKGRYSFIFPLRPGLTRFEVAYQVPYSGSANIDPKSLYPLEHFVVMTPKSMQFTATNASTGFKLINYPQEPDAAVQVASNTTPGENLAFKVSGQGTLQETQEGGAQGSNQAQSAQTTNRPGGGLGPPIDAPDPLQKYRWWILGGFAALLLIGGVYVASRQQSAARAVARQRAASSMPSLQEEDDFEPVEILSTQTMRAARPGSMLMEGIKEELFQLEVERKRGEITQAEYEKAKSALDQTLERALKREAQKA
ncbi:MAG: carboxypeptidase regulatory-like domain-containing protein [Candidatus Sulfotelmatobacter sp.]